MVELLGGAFPEVTRKPEDVIEVLTSEEDQFRRTLVCYIPAVIFETLPSLSLHLTLHFLFFVILTSSLQLRGQRKFKQAAERAKDGKIDGAFVWELWGTYGFPVDLTSTQAISLSSVARLLTSYCIEVMAEEKGLAIDEEGFEAAKQEAIEVW